MLGLQGNDDVEKLIKWYDEIAGNYIECMKIVLTEKSGVENATELGFKLFEKGVEGIEKGLIFAQESESVTGGELAEGRKCIPRDIKPAWQKVIDICFSGESCSMVHYVLKTCAPFNSEKEGSLLGDKPNSLSYQNIANSHLQSSDLPNAIKNFKLSFKKDSNNWKA